MNERKQPASLDDLDARLSAARHKADAAAGRARAPADGVSGFGFAMRIGVELVASLVVGGGIGLLLDNWLGTQPWLMLVFFLLGAAAGFMNVYRVMKNLGQSVGYHRDAVEDQPDKLNKRD
jgi:ATP synthase protein I